MEFMNILLDLLVHNDRVVERVSEDRQNGDDRRWRDNESDQGVEPACDEEVMEQGSKGRNSHLPFEPPRYEQGHNKDESPPEEPAAEAAEAEAPMSERDKLKALEAESETPTV